MDRCHDRKLKRLDLSLHKLPSSLAIAESFLYHNFMQFSLDPNWVEAMGSVEGAVNRKLEVRLVEHTDEVAENKDADDGLWEEDDEEEENSDLKSACETASSSTMDIEVDDGVDIVFPQLHDYLSEHLALPPLVNVREDPTVMKKAAGGAPRVF
ncbi:hypothetical protein JB92DRAFT_3103830 [Gautieria morchelliformis]|nr:hypothetical protein JB92DRAFT_3103830 [Gautieria morchelliformis]